MVNFAYLSKVLLIAGAVVIGGITLLPVWAAGTLDPCEAVARIVLRQNFAHKTDAPLDALANEIAVKISASYARNYGILACYKIIPKALNGNYARN